MSSADRTIRPAHMVGLSNDEQIGLWAVACHEAGHAVAALALDMPFEYVTIRPVQGKSLGHCEHPPLLIGRRGPDGEVVYLKEVIRKGVVSFLAGDAAQAFYGYGDGFFSHLGYGGRVPDTHPLADETDERRAEGYLKLITDGDRAFHTTMRALRARTARLVARESDTIMAVTSALWARETFSYAEVKAIARPRRGRQQVLRKHEEAKR